MEVDRSRVEELRGVTAGETQRNDESQRSVEAVTAPSLNERQRGERLRILMAAGTHAAGGLADLEAVKTGALAEAKAQLENQTLGQADYAILADTIKSTTSMGLARFVDGYLDQALASISAQTLSNNPSLTAESLLDTVGGAIKANPNLLGSSVLTGLLADRLTQVTPETLVKLLEMNAGQMRRDGGIGGGNLSSVRRLAAETLVAAKMRAKDPDSLISIMDALEEVVREKERSGAFSPLTSALVEAQFNSITGKQADEMVDLVVDGQITNAAMKLRNANVPETMVSDELRKIFDSSGAGDQPEFIRQRALEKIENGDVKQILADADVPVDTAGSVRRTTEYNGPESTTTTTTTTSGPTDTSTATQTSDQAPSRAVEDSSPIGRQLTAAQNELKNSLNLNYQRAEQQLVNAPPELRNQILGSLKRDGDEKLQSHNRMARKLLNTFPPITLSTGIDTRDGQVPATRFVRGRVTPQERLDSKTAASITELSKPKTPEEIDEEIKEFSKREAIRKDVETTESRRDAVERSNEIKSEAASGSATEVTSSTRVKDGTLQEPRSAVAKDADESSQGQNTAKVANSSSEETESEIAIAKQAADKELEMQRQLHAVIDEATAIVNQSVA